MLFFSENNYIITL